MRFAQFTFYKGGGLHLLGGTLRSSMEGIGVYIPLRKWHQNGRSTLSVSRRLLSCDETTHYCTTIYSGDGSHSTHMRRGKYAMGEWFLMKPSLCYCVELHWNMQTIHYSQSTKSYLHSTCARPYAKSHAYLSVVG